MDVGGVRTSIVHRHSHEDVLGVGLRVLDLDVEVTVLVEDSGVDELILELSLRPRPIRRHEIVVGISGLRVLVEVPHVGVGRRIVDVEVVLLYVLTVVPLGVGEAEHALLQDWILAVPHCERHAQVLLVVADPGYSVLTPAVGARASLVMREVAPGVAVVAVVLPNRAPLALAQIRPETTPGHPEHVGVP